MASVFRPDWRRVPRRRPLVLTLTPAASGSAPDAPTGLTFTDAHDARVTISTDREGGVTVVGLPPGFVVRH